MKQPNIILILVDDMGFSDMGFMGSEIRTPNIDKLASGGITLTSMYNCARCCPTRASLLTGLYPHKAGIGWMAVDFGLPGYQGKLRNDSITIAEALRPAGYRTLMAGKWHVGGDFDPRQTDVWTFGDVEHPTPRQRGFDRFYGMLDGATSFFAPHHLMEDDDRVMVEMDDFYLTDAITDKASDMIEASVGEDKPFFLYLAYNAPHWPLQAPAEDVARYENAYRGGWDALRGSRHESMIATGALQSPWSLSPRDKAAPAWGDAPHHDWEAQRMAVYAAMVDRMDQGVGKIMRTLERLNVKDDTLVLFLSDNGGCAEPLCEDGWCKSFPSTLPDGRAIESGNRPDLRPGGPTTFMSYDLPWSNVSNAPFRQHKHWVHEGGISTPLVAHWPAGIQSRGFVHQPFHVVDVLPTLLAAAGVSYPTEYAGQALQKVDGESFAPLFTQPSHQRSAPIFWEHEGNDAVRMGDWKLVRHYGQDWELYNMVDDRTELNDLSRKSQPRLDEMARMHAHWATEVGARPWDELIARAHNRYAEQKT